MANLAEIQSFIDLMEKIDSSAKAVFNNTDPVQTYPRIDNVLVSLNLNYQKDTYGGSKVTVTAHPVQVTKLSYRTVIDVVQE